MVGSTGGQYRRKDGTILRTRYYINNNWKSQGSADGVRNINANLLEKKIVSTLQENLSNPGMIKRIENALGEIFHQSEKESSRERELRQIDKQTSEKESECQKLVQAITQAPSIESIISALKITEDQLKILKMRRNQLAQDSGEKMALCPTPVEIVQIVSKHILEFEELFQSAPIDQQKALVRQWINRIEISEKDGQKNVQVFVRTLPKTPEFTAFNEKLCDCGPCRTPNSTDITQDFDPLLYTVVEFEV